MKLLLGHNLSPSLVGLLADMYPENTHVCSLGMDRASDTEVWHYAAKHAFTIVSKDSDFHQRSLILGLETHARTRKIAASHFVKPQKCSATAILRVR